MIKIIQNSYFLKLNIKLNYLKIRINHKLVEKLLKIYCIALSKAIKIIYLPPTAELRSGGIHI